jgi:hypothetical protein
MKKKILAGVAGAILASATFAPAHADIYDLSFSTLDGTAAGFAVLETGTPSLPAFLTGIQGSLTDSSVGPGVFEITGLSTYAGSDNELLATGSGPILSEPPQFSFGGLSFSTSKGVDFNIFSDAGGLTNLGLLNSLQNPVGYPSPDQSTFASVTFKEVSGVPEPATWAMMLFGFVGLGFTGLRKRKVERSAFSAA